MNIAIKTRNIIGSILFNIIYWSYFAIAAIVLLPISYIIPHKSMRTIGYRAAAKVMHPLLRFFIGIKYEVKGIEHLKGQFIIGSNHQSAWETIAIPDIVGNTKNISIVLKQELCETPLLGHYMKVFKNIAIERSKPITTMKNLLSLGLEAKNSGDSILIFITGTRATKPDQGNDGTNYKVGVYALYKNLNMPVVPCVIDSGKCWGKNSFFKRAGTIHVTFKEPIQPGLSREEFDAMMLENFKN